MKKKPILLEFTPLLDVILLMLFLVLMQSEVRVGLMYDEAQEFIETELAALEQEFGEEMDRLRQDSMELDALRFGLEEDTGVIIVNLLPSDAGGNRLISVQADTTTEITLNWDGVVRNSATRQLNEVLANSIRYSDHTLSFIIFQYNGRAIFNDDRELVRTALHNHRLANPQVFYTELDSR